MLVCNVALWLDNAISPCNLMIDDLSDAYIDKYDESRRNDWGYMTDERGSSFDFLKTHLLDMYPEIKITFFVPYLKHSVISDDTNLKTIKYGIGERKEFSIFLTSLVEAGHEISHHGSTHGCYDREGIWHQEWELFDDVNKGVTVTVEGKRVFENTIDYKLLGGKYCGYRYNQYSSDIISESNFLYWCNNAVFFIPSCGKLDDENSNVIDFPTTIPGNIFVKYKYQTEIRKKDLIKKVLSPFHFIFDFFNQRKIHKLIQARSILSIQEHYSPSTTRGIVQSANIHSDIKSLNKIFSFLTVYDIWYATCADISKYFYAKEKSSIVYTDKKLTINYDDTKKVGSTFITLVFNRLISLTKDDEIFSCNEKRNEFFITLPLSPGENDYLINYDK